MSDREKWLLLNRELEKVCSEMVEEFTGGPTSDRAVDILSGFLRKAQRLLAASNRLAETSHWDELQILARVLFELRVKTDYFLVMLNSDAELACRTVMDAWLIQRIKEWESSNWVGVKPELRKYFESQIDELKKRLDEKNIKRLRKHGFPGINLESCAKEVDRGDAYQTIYRWYSRAIHSSDYVEFMAGPNVKEELRYREWRDPITAYTVHFCAGGITESGPLRSPVIRTRRIFGSPRTRWPITPPSINDSRPTLNRRSISNR